MEAVGIGVAIGLGIIIGKDAKSRGMNAWGWGLFTVALAIVAIPIYLIVRNPKEI